MRLLHTVLEIQHWRHFRRAPTVRRRRRRERRGACLLQFL